MKGKRGEKRIRRLGRAEMCNVKHHRCQLGNLGPGLAPIHKSRRLELRAGPMWIESEVAAGPPDAGGGWPGWVAASKAKRPDWAQREQRRAREPGLGWAEGEDGKPREGEAAERPVWGSRRFTRPPCGV